MAVANHILTFAAAAAALVPSAAVGADPPTQGQLTELPHGADYLKLRRGLDASRAVFERERAGRVTFLGGSITANPGWRDEVMRYLGQRFPETRFDFVAAGVPSLGSVPNAFRFSRDVLARGRVDLLFVEAAVNDPTNGATPQRMVRGLEGIVRQARLANSAVDVIEMHFAMPEHTADYAAGRTPVTIRQHESVAAHYGLPSLNLAREVAERMAAGQFDWARDFVDLHPSPFGQRLYANSIVRMLEAAWKGPGRAPGTRKLPPPLDPRSYFRARLLPVADARIVMGFAIDPRWRPVDGKEARAGYVDVPALVGATPGAEFSVNFDGTALGLMIASGPDAGIVEFSIDGAPARRADAFTPWSTALHLPWALMLDDDLPAGKHRAVVRIAPGHHPSGVGTALRVFGIMVN